MNLAKVSANGQITVPVEVRRHLGLRSGDKVLFYTNSEGEMVVENASAQALKKAQAAFSGAAKMIGVVNEEDVNDLMAKFQTSKASK